VHRDCLWLEILRGLLAYIPTVVGSYRYQSTFDMWEVLVATDRQEDAVYTLSVAAAASAENRCLSSFYVQHLLVKKNSRSVFGFVRSCITSALYSDVQVKKFPYEILSVCILCHFSSFLWICINDFCTLRNDYLLCYSHCGSLHNTLCV